MKRIFTILFAAMLTGQTWAEDFTIGNLKYTITSTNTVSVGVVSDAISGEITIPSEVEHDDANYAVTSIAENAFYNCSQLISITIPNSVTNIGSLAFYNCKSLKLLIIPESVTNIGANAFSGDNIVVLMSNIDDNGDLVNRNWGAWKVLRNAVFDGDWLYEDAEKTQLVQYLGNGGDVTIPSTVTHIGSIAFYNCFDLTSVTIPNSVTWIGSSFISCFGLTSVNIPNSVTSIGGYAFSNCTSLTTVTISESVTKIGSDAFYLCPNLVFNEYDNAYYLGNAENQYLALIKAKSTDITSCEINDKCKIIEDGAFNNCTSLTSISIPKSITLIGGSVFKNCSGLTSLNIPNSVTSIGDNAFNGCNNLNSVFVPNTVSSIGWYAFEGVGKVIYSGTANGSPWGAQSVSSYSSGFKFKVDENNSNEVQVTKYEGTDYVVVIPSIVEINNKTYTVTSISESAFSSCWDVKVVYLSNTITSIGATTFSGSYKLQYNTFDNALYVGTQENPYFALVKAKNKNITSCQINSDCKVIASFAFEDCEALANITIPDSVTHIGRMAFNNCLALETAYMGKSMVKIGDDAFNFCEKLKTVSIPTTIKHIGYTAFYGCDSLQYNTYDNALYLGNDTNKYVVLMKPKADDIKQCLISDSCRIIYNSAFLNCAALDSVSIPSSVWSIGSNAFSNTALRNVVLPKSLTTIETGLFNECTKLESVVIPASVTSIGNNAFYWCESLTSVTLPDSLTQIGGSAFNYCLGLKKIIIPMTVDSIGRAAFFRCNKATLYCEADSIPTHWDKEWNSNGGKVVWKYCGNGHNSHTSVTDAAVAATCTEPGLAEGSHCSVCGTIIVKQDTIPAKGHTIVVDKAVKPTCTETGLGEGKHCSECNDYFWTQELLPALGHEFVNYIYNNDATTTADGTETAVCEHGCGETNTRVKEGTKLATTAVAESAANAVNIYATGNKIVIENATDEIFVYNAMGVLVGRDVARNVSTIKVNNPGVYIVKTGSAVKRVVVN